MKRLLLAAILAIAFASPAVAAPKHHVTGAPCYDEGRYIAVILPSADVVYVPKKALLDFPVRCRFMKIDTYEVTAPLFTPEQQFDYKTQMQLVDHPGGLGNLKFDDLTGGLIISPGTGLTFPISSVGTFNSTAPSLLNGQTVGAQVDSAGALVFADGGKTYVLLNQAVSTCVMLFSAPIRVNEVDNPGVAQTQAFGLYDDAGTCAGTPVFGPTTAHLGDAGVGVMGPVQYIKIGIKTGTGLSIQWKNGGQAVAGSIPLIQVQ